MITVSFKMRIFRDIESDIKITVGSAIKPGISMTFEFDLLTIGNTRRNG